MNKKELLKKYISEELFEDLSIFVEDLYFMDCEYLILMARKFYSLFCVFHELNREKYNKLGISYESNVKIVSDRALPLLKHLLTEGKHKIVIGDDIIIHGRGIRELYKRLSEKNPNLDILIEAFVINNDDTSVYGDIIDKIHSYYEEPADKWRDISNRIVASFWLSGRPYISYLPYFVLDATWGELVQKLNQEDCISITNFDLKYYDVDLLVYFGKEFDALQNLNCCNIAAVRFYNYKRIGKIIAIPYFCTETIGEKSIRNLSDVFRKKLFIKKYIDKVNANNGAEDMRLMEFEYSMSLILAKFLFCRAGIKIKEWARDIEISTFSEYMIKNTDFEELDADEYFKHIVNVDKCTVRRKAVVPKNEKELDSEYKKIKTWYRNQYEAWNNKKNWIEETDLLQRYIEKLLLVNGNIDEARCQNSDQEERTRLLGMPVSYLLNDSAEFWASLDKSKNVEYFKKRLFAEIVAAIDSGKGSIVIRNVNDGNREIIRESLLHAGEQNYKYYEATNYPFMYGLLLIEHKAKAGGFYMKQSELKRLFQEKFNKYLDSRDIGYSLEEQNQLSAMTMMNEYGRFLLNVSAKYKGNEVAETARMCAREVIAENLNG